MNAAGHIWLMGLAPSELTDTWLAHLDGTTWSTFEAPEWMGLSRLGPRVGPDGAAWFGGHDGLWRFDGQEWIRVGFAGSRVEPLSVTDDGTVWFITDTEALYRLPAEAQ